MAQTSIEAETGALLRAARERKGLTCRAVAQSLGINHSELSRIERGRVTSLSRYDEIARAIGLRVVVRFRPDSQRAA